MKPVGQASLARLLKLHFGWTYKKAKKIVTPALTSAALLLKQQSAQVLVNLIEGDTNLLFIDEFSV